MEVEVPLGRFLQTWKRGLVDSEEDSLSIRDSGTEPCHIHLHLQEG